MPVFDIPMVTRDRVHSGKLFMFAFDDDETRRTESGMAGQCRGEANGVGIRIRRAPDGPMMVWTDNDILRQQQMMDEDFAILISWAEAGGSVFLPKAGLGNVGTPRLVDTAPRTFLYLQKKVKELRASAASPWSIDAYKQPGFYEGVFRQVAALMRPQLAPLAQRA